MKKINRIVIFTVDAFHSNAAYSKIIEEFKDKIVLIVESQRYGGKYGSFFYQLKKNYFDSGLQFVNYLSFHFIYYKFFIYIAAFVNLILLRKRKIYNLHKLAKKFNIPIVKTKEVKNEWVVEKIRNLNPDLIITSNFDQLLSKEIIGIPNFLAINIHTSLLPNNRGPFPALWSVINNKDEIGVTIHYLTSKFDEGEILKQVRDRINPGESILGLDRRLLRLGAKMIIDVVSKFEKRGEVYSYPQRNFDEYYSFPRKTDLKRLKASGIKLYTIKDFIKDFI